MGNGISEISERSAYSKNLVESLRYVLFASDNCFSTVGNISDKGSAMSFILYGDIVASYERLASLLPKDLDSWRIGKALRFLRLLRGRSCLDSAEKGEVMPEQVEAWENAAKSLCQTRTETIQLIKYVESLDCPPLRKYINDTFYKNKSDTSILYDVLQAYRWRSRHMAMDSTLKSVMRSEMISYLKKEMGSPKVLFSMTRAKLYQGELSFNRDQILSILEVRLNGNLALEKLEIAHACWPDNEDISAMYAYVCSEGTAPFPSFVHSLVISLWRECGAVGRSQTMQREQFCNVAKKRIYEPGMSLLQMLNMVCGIYHKKKVAADIQIALVLRELHRRGLCLEIC